MTGTIHVCTGCTHPDRSKREAGPGGADLKIGLDAIVEEAGLARVLKVAGYPCLGNCDRRCRMSIAGHDRWSWLFGGIEPDAIPEGLMAFVRKWLAAPDGFLSKEERPPTIRRLLIGRVPPR